MNFETIKLEIADRKATLLLNRPHAMNAMDFTMMRELAECFEALHNETDVQILVIKGEGKVFSAGGDVKMMAASEDFSDFGTVMGDIARLVKAYYTLPMITIAQIHGASAGLGFSLALGSDIIVAEESSKLAMNFIGIGLIPDGAGHFFMKQRLGTVKAKQMIWEGKVLNGEEALALSLIDYNVPDGAAAVTVDQLVGKLLASPILAMIETKQILHNANLPELDRILEGESAGQVKMRQTKDHFEGIKAFVEKRAPQFTGK
ncbi:enoyl-CoA hydratase [Lysinibacillus sp. 2017]|uniref:enoyl-CoA hydratase n=1 Tax=unclassified Lysinibacillus TaxID=2636778 RepID=UPI000D5296AC|nr:MULTISPECIES: enoyl-CoA hydratase [unclassified Lysinibacillus]AWE08686.1 enoyl-CoA hydratase [Lysinibacillus sp. 2017]TGN35107.1 enoyl-CoA hydratase [Lysinibacillus sp. S2017]